MPVSTVTLDIVHGYQGAFLTVHTKEGSATIGPIASAELNSNQCLIGVVEPPATNATSQPSSKKKRRRSIRQEEEIAERQGGRRVRGSGAVAGHKGDVRDPGTYRLEAKYTQAKSYRVAHEDLVKVRGECTGMEIPMFEIHFVHPHTLKTYDRWVMLDARYLPYLEYKPPNATPDDS